MEARDWDDSTAMKAFFNSLFSVLEKKESHFWCPSFLVEWHHHWKTYFFIVKMEQNGPLKKPILLLLFHWHKRPPSLLPHTMIWKHAYSCRVDTLSGFRYSSSFCSASPPFLLPMHYSLLYAPKPHIRKRAFHKSLKALLSNLAGHLYNRDFWNIFQPRLFRPIHRKSLI